MFKSYFVAGILLLFQILILESIGIQSTRAYSLGVERAGVFWYKCELIGFLPFLGGLNFRPFSNEELRNNAPQVVTCNDYQREVAVSQNIAGKHIDRVFTFDKVGFPQNQGFC